MFQKIRKVVIPVAGFGTRFLPVTKAQPKEMLPLVDRPMIQYIVEEAIASGIEDIILVTSQSKRAIEDHFDRSFELEDQLKKAGKEKYLKEVREISQMANFIYIRQKGPYGNGTPVLNARSIIGDEPFAVVWGDDFVKGGSKPHIKQLIDVYEKYGDPVVTAIDIDDEGTNKYGVIDGKEVEENVLQVNSIIEKPGPKKAPSRVGSVGGYILTPDIFDTLDNIPLGKDNELWLVDAIFELSKKRSIYACKVDGKFCDLGSKAGWLKTNIEFALENEEIKDELKKYLDSL